MCFVICSASAPFCCTDVSDHCLFAEALLAIVRTMRAGLVFWKGVSKHTVSEAKATRCRIVFAVCLKSFIANVTAEHLICVVVCVCFFHHQWETSLVAMMLWFTRCHKCLLLQRTARSRVACMWLEGTIGMLRIAKMNVFSLLPQGFSHLFLDRIYRFQFWSRLAQHGVLVILCWIESTGHGHGWQNWFAWPFVFVFESQRSLFTSCDLWTTFIGPCRLLRHSALGHWCCRALRVPPFSLDSVVRVVCPLVSPILLQILTVADLSVPFSMTSQSTACLLPWRWPFLLTRFVILSSDSAHVNSHYQSLLCYWKRHAS